MLVFAGLMITFPARATVLWSHPEPVLVCDNDRGQDILRGAIEPRGPDSSGTLYFRIRTDPIADTAAKVIGQFEAGFMLVEKGEERLGIGNAGGAVVQSFVCPSFAYRIENRDSEGFGPSDYAFLPYVEVSAANSVITGIPAGRYPAAITSAVPRTCSMPGAANCCNAISTNAA